MRPPKQTVPNPALRFGGVWAGPRHEARVGEFGVGSSARSLPRSLTEGIVGADGRPMGAVTKKPGLWVTVNPALTSTSWWG